MNAAAKQSRLLAAARFAGAVVVLLLGSLLVAVVTLAGCAAVPAGPTHAEVAERVEIEMNAVIEADWSEFADEMADDILDRKACASEVYRAGLGDDRGLLYAFESTCLMFFGDEMSDGQIERAKWAVAAFVVDQIGEE